MKPIFNRRDILAAAGAGAIVLIESSAFTLRGRPRMAFAASGRKLHVYTMSSLEWHPLETHDSEAPIALVIGSRARTLHVLHAVDQHRNLPRGYIESFRIAPAGSLQPLGKQPLSLSATQPRHLAISQDGKLLAVSIPGGSAYNLLPIREDGTPAPPIAIRKETALSANTPSIPGPLTFNLSSNRLFALDLGHKTLSIFSAQPAMPLLARFTFPESFTPAELVADGGGDRLTVTGNSSIVYRFHYDPASGALTATQEMQQRLDIICATSPLPGVSSPTATVYL